MALHGCRGPMLHARRALALSAMALWHVLAGAAQAGVALSPLQQQVPVRPGGKGELSLTVEYVRRSGNPTRARVTFEVMDFAISRDGVLSLGSENKHARSAVMWITLDQRELTLEPGQIRKVKGTVTAPASAEGDYWAAVVMTVRGPPQEQGVNVVLRTASAVFVRVARRHYSPRPRVDAVEALLPRFDEPEAPMPGGKPGALLEQTFGPALMVTVDVSDGDLIGFMATGEAHVYLDGRRRVATIPLYAHRHHLLPGQQRRLVGLLPTPLPPGRYTVRFVLEADSNPAQRSFGNVAFEISPDMAQQWQERARPPEGPSFEVSPADVSQVLKPGRLTAASVTVTNRTGGTMQVRCQVERGQLPDGWVSADPAEFTLGPGMKRSFWCVLKIPAQAQEGRYSGALVVEAAGARLTAQGGPDRHEIPVHIEVEK